MDERQETLEVHRFNAEKLGMPFYVDIGTSVVAVRRTSNHDVIWRADHDWGGNVWIDEAKRICAIMNEEARHPIGNGAKMREALEAVDDAFSDGSLYASGDCPTPHDVSVFEDVRDKVKAALAEPPRNCDVGTAEEQAKRHVGWCDRLNHCSRTHSCRECFAKWAQMPYEEGGEK